MRHIVGTKIVGLVWGKSFSAVWTPVFRQFVACLNSTPSPRGVSSGIGEAISVRHLLRVRRWERDSLLHLPYIPGPKEVAQSLSVTC